MDPKFVVPISTMLAGLGLWVVYLIARGFSPAVRNWPARVVTGVAVGVGGLIVLSGFA